MEIRTLRNKPLQPLAARMREFAKTCDWFDIATAFVTERAMKDLIGHALEGGAKVRFLTGTFGSNTRKTTFNTLWRLSQKRPVAARVWRCTTHQNFHAKLYLWRFRNGRGVAWVGSSNFTDGGLQSEGELLVEFTGRWDGQEMRRLREAFEYEWKRGAPLSQEFIEMYVESKRKPPDFGANRKRGLGARISRRLPSDNRGFFMTSVRRHFPGRSRVYQRVEELLGGTADFWVYHFSKTLFQLQVGQRGFLIDTVDGEVALVEVTDRRRDGNAHIFSYLPVFKRKGSVPWNAATRKTLAAAGLRSTSKVPRTGWVSTTVGMSVANALYPGRVMSR